MITTFFPPHVGGIEYHVLNLSKHLANKGHRITILTSLLPKIKLGSHKMLDGIEIVRIKTFFLPRWPYRSLSSVGVAFNAEKTMVGLVKEKDVDVIHAHGHHYPLTWSAINIAHKLSLPSVLTLHGMYALNPTNLLARAMEEIFNLTVFRRELKKANAVIGLTPTITDFARRYGSSSNTYFTIPNGVDIEVFQENSKNKQYFREKYGVPERKVVILFRGRFSSVKGVLELAEAARVLAKKYNEMFFLFVGDGPLCVKLKQTLKSIKASSKIIGWTPVSEIPELYIASDIYVLPSKWEALPITLIEAMTSFLHIVAMPVGGIPDVIANYPWKTYIEGFSPSHIVKALETSLHAIYNKESGSGYVDITRYDWGRISGEIEDVYRNSVKFN